MYVDEAYESGSVRRCVNCVVRPLLLCVWFHIYLCFFFVIFSYAMYAIKSASDHRFLDTQSRPFAPSFKTFPTRFSKAPNTGATFSATFARPFANFLVALAPALTAPRPAMTTVVMISVLRWRQPINPKGSL